MSTPILATKLYIPPARSKVVVRLRLIEELNKSLSSGRRLTLISAPAGFGKTTLVSEWVTECGRPVAWLSLDEEDDDPTRFFVYFINLDRTASHLDDQGLTFCLIDDYIINFEQEKNLRCTLGLAK